MAKRVIVTASILLGLLVIGGVALSNMAHWYVGWDAGGKVIELKDKFTESVMKGDAAAVKALSVDQEAARIWETVDTAQIDKAEKIEVRGAGWTTRLTDASGYFDLTARSSSGPSVPFRIEMVRGGNYPSDKWRIRAVVVDATK